jgi:cell division FtsZ-interacting protein ZapD
MIARRLLNENVELMIRFEKIKNQLTINNSLLKHVTSSTYVVFRIFDVLTHDLRVVDI